MIYIITGGTGFIDTHLAITLNIIEDEEYHYHGRCWFHRLTRRRNLPCLGRFHRRLGRPHLAFRQHKENGTNQFRFVLQVL